MSNELNGKTEHLPWDLYDTMSVERMDGEGWQRDPELEAEQRAARKAARRSQQEPPMQLAAE